MSASLDASVLALMRSAAERAIMPRYRALGAHEVSDKAVGELVTVADFECEAILAEGLARILPDAAVLGEEAVSANPALAHRLGDGLCWIVDPLDGTNNFVRGCGPFGVMVALAEAGEVIGGWILDPVSGRVCHAARGAGAWIDGERVLTRRSGGVPEIAAISSLYGSETHRAVRDVLGTHYHLVDIPRCAAEQYPRLVTGVNDLTLFGRTLAWDHAPGVVFLIEAGGRAARTDGAAYRVGDDRDGLIAAALPEAWDVFAAALNAFEQSVEPA
jgi:fructose-1,6-bisphosphatase/inositol monophosphatase family enzyme